MKAAVAIYAVASLVAVAAYISFSAAGYVFLASYALAWVVGRVK